MSSSDEDPRFASAAVNIADIRQYKSDVQTDEKVSKKPDAFLLKILLESIRERIIFVDGAWGTNQIGMAPAPTPAPGFAWFEEDRLPLNRLVKRRKRAREAWEADRTNKAKRRAYKKAKAAMVEAKGAASVAKEREARRDAERAALRDRIYHELCERDRVILEKIRWFEEWAHEYARRMKQQRKAAKATKRAGKPINTVFVVGFPKDCTRERALSIFSAHKGYKALSFNKKEGKAPISFVRYESVAAATQALDALQGFNMDGSKLRVAFAKYELKL